MDFNQVDQTIVSAVADKRNQIPRKSLNIFCIDICEKFTYLNIKGDYEPQPPPKEKTSSYAVVSLIRRFQF